MKQQFDLQKHIETGVEKIVKDTIRSRLFDLLREEHVMEESHVGGCVLFTQRDKVEKIMADLAAEQK